MSLTPKWLQRQHFKRKLQENKKWLEQNKPYFISHGQGRSFSLTHNFDSSFDVENLPPNERRIAHFKHFTHPKTKATIETSFALTASRAHCGYFYRRGLYEQRIRDGMWMVCEGAPVELIHVPSPHLVRDIATVDWQTERHEVAPDKK